jgi:predicted RND superfamily exporter protein
MLMALGISYGINVYNTYLQEKKDWRIKKKLWKKQWVK